MKDLALKIKRHAQALQNLQAQIDSLHAEVDEKTSEAREKLLTYQILKRQTENALDDVAAGYEQAQSLFNEADGFLEKLKAIKDQHIKLSREFVREAEASPNQASGNLSELRAARNRLKDLYQQIERLRDEAHPAELDETTMASG